jgi:Ran GTPase-activating protein (RanGAP) involved in mRNA processing and transport
VKFYCPGRKFELRNVYNIDLTSVEHKKVKQQKVKQQKEEEEEEDEEDEDEEEEGKEGKEERRGSRNPISGKRKNSNVARWCTFNSFNS